jgi:galactokinase/mevalonate kinase-like predicted kinase
MKPRVVEATAPCRVDLEGGEPGGPGVAVAIDRRVGCRVETGIEGVELESDSLAARVLAALGLERGVRVSTHSRVPEGSGLGEEVALAVALTGALAAALGRELSPEAIVRLAADAARGAAPEADRTAAETAVRGGAVVAAPGGGEGDGAVLEADPGRIEECLMLVDAGAQASAPPPPPAAARSVRAALLEGRFEDVVDLWVEEWAARERLSPGWPPPEAGRLAALVRTAGGAARLCGAGRGRVLAVWAPPGPRGPGPREAVQFALRAAGVRAFPARVDLRGLEVE